MSWNRNNYSHQKVLKETFRIKHTSLAPEEGPADPPQELQGLLFPSLRGKTAQKGLAKEGTFGTENNRKKARKKGVRWAAPQTKLIPPSWDGGQKENLVTSGPKEGRPIQKKIKRNHGSNLHLMGQNGRIHPGQKERATQLNPVSQNPKSRRNSDPKGTLKITHGERGNLPLPRVLPPLPSKLPWFKTPKGNSKQELRTGKYENRAEP